MSAGIESVTESNCEARTLVGRHRAWTRSVLWTAWLMVPLGLCCFGSPFATLSLFSPETNKSLWGFSHEGSPPAQLIGVLGVGLVSVLVGTAVGIVLLWRLSGYARTERLLTTAQELGLRFAFPSCERTWEGLVESSPHWPRSSRQITMSVAGLFVGQHQGVRLAMLEPSELYDMPFVPFMSFIEPTYSPVRYRRTHMLIFVVLPDTQAVSTTTLALPASLEQSAQEQGFAIETTAGAVVVVATKGDLADLDQARQVLDWSVRFWKHLRPGSEQQR